MVFGCADQSGAIPPPQEHGRTEGCFLIAVSYYLQCDNVCPTTTTTESTTTTTTASTTTATTTNYTLYSWYTVCNILNVEFTDLAVGVEI